MIGSIERLITNKENQSRDVKIQGQKTNNKKSFFLLTSDMNIILVIL